jgi:hypothetical protein
MSRAVNEMHRCFDKGIISSSPTVFFFQKAASKALDIDSCLRSMVRQLPWDCEALAVRSQARQLYEEYRRKQRHDVPIKVVLYETTGSLTSGQGGIHHD